MANKPSPALPILYSFRRCPYAMRGRMGLFQAGIQVELREVDLKNRPEHLYEISPKGTVPVLLLPAGTVIEESLEIMIWALEQSDPDGWLENREVAMSLIEVNDGQFKYALDRYKYPNRYPDEDCSDMRERGLDILKNWNERIDADGFLNGEAITLADIAIFPFVRQFAHTDIKWWDEQSDIAPLRTWLDNHKNSALFKSIMDKFEPWEASQPPITWP